VVKGERHDQDRDGRRTENAADDEQAAAVAGALAGRCLLALLLAQRL
jgi:hypothetical protein